MNELILGLSLWQVLLPLVLIAANTVVLSASRSGLMLRTAAIFVALAYAALAGLWLFPPWWTPYAFMALLVLGAGFRYARTGSSPAAKRRWGERIAAIVAIVGTGLILLPAINGRAVPPAAIDLAMPLGPGRYLVTSGGATQAINAHFFTLTADHARAFRGQSYAVDIIGIDRYGLRAKGISPTNPKAYVIYGTPVLAPCDGTVGAVTDGVADMPVPQMDRANLTGNSVILLCAGHYILLAHLAPGSITVKQGADVATGTMIGAVGNSGNTGEPHLHIHVQSALPAQDPLSADPVWFTLNGRFLVRNARFTLPE